MKTVVVIQARTGSSRLPGKVLMPLAGKTLLERMVERVQAARTRFAVIVATTDDPSDNPIATLCSTIGVPCFRGHPSDLLDRHYRAALSHGADIVAKIPSDCPLIDPAVIDRVFDAYFASPDAYDFVSNLHPPSYPDGNDVEVVPLTVLETAWREASKDFEREHTTPFIWEHPERFRLANVTWETGLDYSMSHRFTIDYREDFDFISAVYDHLWKADRPVFSLGDILALLRREPGLMTINTRYAGVNWYRLHLQDLTTINATHTRTP